MGGRFSQLRFLLPWGSCFPHDSSWCQADRIWLAQMPWPSSRERFIWLYSSREVKSPSGQDSGCRWPSWHEEQLESSHPELQAGSRKSQFKMAGVFKLSKPTSSDIHPPTKPHLILPKYSDAQDQCFSVCGSQPLGLHIRCPAYQSFTIHNSSKIVMK